MESHYGNKFADESFVRAGDSASQRELTSSTLEKKNLETVNAVLIRQATSYVQEIVS